MNSWNKPLQRNNTSGYTGVIKLKGTTRRRSLAVMGCKGKDIRIGIFDTPEEAALAWNAKAIELRGPHTYLNVVHAITAD
jgi:hypothetical protein